MSTEIVNYSETASMAVTAGNDENDATTLDKPVGNYQKGIGLNKTLKIGLPKEVVAEELFVSSLVPEGELSSLLFPKMKPWFTSSKADILEKTRKRFAKVMKPYVVQRWQKRITISDYISYYSKKLKDSYK